MIEPPCGWASPAASRSGRCCGDAARCVHSGRDGEASSARSRRVACPSPGGKAGRHPACGEHVPPRRSTSIAIGSKTLRALTTDDDEAALGSLDATREGAGGGIEPGAIVRYCLWRQGRADTAGLACGIAATPSPSHLAVFALIELDALRPASARALATEAQRRSQSGWALSVATSVIAQVLHDERALGAGWCERDMGLAESRHDLPVDAVLLGARACVQMLADEGRVAAALDLVARLEALGRERGASRLRLAAIAERTRLHLAVGASGNALAARERFRVEAAAALGLSAAARFDVEVEQVKLEARVAAALAIPPSMEAVRAVERLRRQAVRRRRPRRDLELRVQAGLLRFEQGRSSEAMPILEDAFRRVAASGAGRCLRDEGDRLAAPAHMLASVARDEGAVLGACLGLASRAPDPATPDPMEAALTSRERSIVRLLARGLSNKEIGRDLGIAPETVKSHLHSAYVKLNTRTRAEAVAVASGLRDLREA